MTEDKVKFTTVLLEEASCLDASFNSNTVEPVTLSFIQPKGRLIRTEKRGPHYAKNDIEAACTEVGNFLKSSKVTQSQLVIAPEYFTPLLFMTRLSENQESYKPDDLFHPHSLYILPIETIPIRDFHNLLIKFRCGKWTVVDTEFAVKDMDLFKIKEMCVNTCAIIIVTATEKKVFFQHKYFRSQVEEDYFLPGKEVFVFCGMHYFLMNFICSDLNDCTPFFDINKAAFRKAGGFITHVQWNPCPDFQLYETLRSLYFDNTLGQNRYLISVNWSPGSSIAKNGGPTIQLTRALPRIYRCSTKHAYSFDGPQIGCHGITYEKRFMGPHNRWLILHFLHTKKCICKLGLTKPLENVSYPAATRTWLIKEPQVVAMDGKKELSAAENGLTEPFWYCLDSLAPRNRLDSIKRTTSYPVLEHFCASFFLLLSPSGNYIHNALARVPSAPLLCSYCTKHVKFSDGECAEGKNDFTKRCPISCSNHNQHCVSFKEQWIKEMELIKTSLVNFIAWGKDASSDWELVADIDEKCPYPVNCYSSSLFAKGIMFNGRGQSCSKLCETLDLLLNIEDNIIDRNRGVKRFFLFASEVQVPFNTNALLRQWNIAKLSPMIYKEPCPQSSHHICDYRGITHNCFNDVKIFVKKT